MHSPLWRLPTLEDYERLAEESEYAAWVIYNRYYLNHFTISVHTLPQGYDTVADFNTFLKKHGFKLNDSGGEVKTSPDEKLLQSSTVAKMIEAEFTNGETKEISGSYVEFAERVCSTSIRIYPRERSNANTAAKGLRRATRIRFLRAPIARRQARARFC